MLTDDRDKKVLVVIVDFATRRCGAMVQHVLQGEWMQGIVEGNGLDDVPREAVDLSTSDEMYPIRQS